MLRLYAALVTGSCIAAFLAYPLPEFLPVKRALAIGFCIYHSVVSIILFQTPRFINIPHILGPFFEPVNLTPEVVWGTFHGLLGLGMVVWWQGTLQYIPVFGMVYLLPTDQNHQINQPSKESKVSKRRRSKR
ncbi:hypothetical protein CY34DRAFT_804741 [Suillus luteus UH-Slu-Lm8-n1]|uniref:Uncharacterized protein n=1 Tax=Suillus luteus UH-Slu-Lm8-n1 TaxID=930992 RepID=A0A0D0AL67_9AGAM|nr:hypothetical protein CY34DRAFT_804741 [Suillus luteus UH-Slu-Lm8-n1]